jgi:hypothetical protein
MRLAAIDRMTPSMPDLSLPVIRLEQRPARQTVGARLAFLLLAATLLLFPFYLLVSTALADQTLRDAVATRPMATVQVLTGLAFWIFLFGLPIARLVDAVTRTRTVEIADGLVTVHDRAFGRGETWQAPVAAFSGVAHYLRASLSGVRHELILVHPERERSVLLTVADSLLQSDLDRVCGALSLSELPASAFHRPSHKGPVLGARAAVPALATPAVTI